MPPKAIMGFGMGMACVGINRPMIPYLTALLGPPMPNPAVPAILNTSTTAYCILIEIVWDSLLK